MPQAPFGPEQIDGDAEQVASGRFLAQAEASSGLADGGTERVLSVLCICFHAATVSLCFASALFCGIQVGHSCFL
jgi:hypothetical protein